MKKILISLTFLLLINSVYAATYYVAKDGSGDYSTIQSAVNAANYGDTVYVRAGSYNEQLRISTSRITVAGVSGTRPRIYAGSISGGEYLVSISGSNINFRNFEIDNSPRSDAPQRGLGITGNNNRISNVRVHNSWKSGVLITGDSNIFENGVVYDNSLRTDGRTSGCLSTTGWAEDNIIRNNVVYHNEGEAVSCFRAYRTVIDGNIVYDNAPENIYIDNCPGGVVQNNLVYHTGDSKWRSGPGIEVRDEESAAGTAQSVGLKVVNNFVYGTNKCFSFSYHDSSRGLKDVLIAYNTFVNAGRLSNFRIKSGANHENTVITNNIILQEDSLTIADVPSDSELHFSYNLWSRSPSSSARGSGDIYSDPRLSKSGSISPGQLTPDWFKLTSSSPAINSARVISQVTTDFFGSPRGSNPDMGAHEFGGTPSVTTTTTTSGYTTTTYETTTTTTSSLGCSYCGDTSPCSGGRVCDYTPGVCIDRLGEGQGDCDCDENCQSGLYCDFVTGGDDYCCPIGTSWDGSSCSGGTVTTTTIISTTTTTGSDNLPEFFNLRHNPATVLVGHAVDILVDWFDDVGLQQIIIQENSTGEWRSHTVYG